MDIGIPFGDERLFFAFRKANENLFKEILTGKIKLSGFEDLNDPYENKFFVKSIDDVRLTPLEIDSIISTIPQLKNYPEELFGTVIDGEHKAAFGDKDLENFLSAHVKERYCATFLSKTFWEPLMWAHYADKHKGVCLVYRAPEKFEQDERFSPVTYSSYPHRHIEADDLKEYFSLLKKRTLTEQEFLLLRQEIQRGIKPKSSINSKFIDKTIFQKSIEWNYEQEWRYIKKLSAHDLAQNQAHVYCSKFHLVGIIAGANCCDSFTEALRRCFSDKDCFVYKAQLTNEGILPSA